MELTDKQKELCKQGNTITRTNLLTQNGYRPYCGEFNCKLDMPRTTQNADLQFECGCGWVSAFPKDFIDEYKKVWGINHG